MHEYVDLPLPEVVDGEVCLPVIVSLSINSPQNLTKHSHSTSHIVTTHKNGAVRVASWNLNRRRKQTLIKAMRDVSQYQWSSWDQM